MSALRFLTGTRRQQEDGPSAREALQRLRHDPETAHAFESLLSGLELRAEGQSIRTLLLTSTQPLEGKSTVALQLGLAAASVGAKRVLLIDGDLREPALSRRLGREVDAGLAELMQGGKAAADVVRAVLRPEDRADLWFVPAGCAGPDFLTTLDRTHARAVLQDVGERFDLVLIDSPPVLAVNDAVMLASAADGVLLIVSAGRVEGKSASLAKERLARSGTPILGVVLNRFEASLHGHASHPYPDYGIGWNSRPFGRAGASAAEAKE